jgi:hypothetical protein
MLFCKREKEGVRAMNVQWKRSAANGAAAVSKRGRQRNERVRTALLYCGRGGGGIP